MVMDMVMAKIPNLDACYHPEGYEGYSQYDGDCWDMKPSHPTFLYAVHTYPAAAFLDDALGCMLIWMEIFMAISIHQIPMFWLAQIAMMKKQRYFQKQMV